MFITHNIRHGNLPTPGQVQNAQSLGAGTRYKVQWVAVTDGRTCDFCYDLDGAVRPLSSPFYPEGVKFGDQHGGGGNPAKSQEHNCLPAGVTVSALGVEATVSREYEGELILLETARGGKLACTPNHPIATPTGWVPANMLDVGSYAVGSELGNWKNDRERKPAKIKEVVESFQHSVPRSRLVQIPVVAEDFHGDGTGSEVAMIGTNGLLRGDGNAAKHEHLFQRAFPLPASSQVGGVYLPLAFVFGHALPFQLLGFLTPPDIDAPRFEFANNYGSADMQSVLQGFRRFPLKIAPNNFGLMLAPNTEAVGANASFLEAVQYKIHAYMKFLCQLLAATSGCIFLDKIINIDRQVFRGHVFNLQTRHGCYVSENIITSNCRCNEVLVPAGRR